MKRKIGLLTVKETTPDAGEIEFSYAETLISALRAGGFQGITIGEMKDRLDALDIIEAAQKEGAKAVLLTPKQHGALKAAVDPLYLDQADLSEGFIRFASTVATGNPIEEVGAKLLSVSHYIRINVVGATGSGWRYIQVGTLYTPS